MPKTAPPRAPYPYALTVRDNVLIALEATGHSRYDVWKALDWSESATYRRFDGSVEFGLTQLEQIAGWLDYPLALLTSPATP